MSLTSTIADLRDAMRLLASRAQEMAVDVERRLEDVQAEAAALRGVLERVGVDRDADALWADINRVLAAPAGAGWVSPEKHAAALAKQREAVLRDVNSRIAEVFGQVGGMGSSADAFLAIFKMMREVDDEPAVNIEAPRASRKR